MLTYSNCCIQVALSVNRATCCFDTSQGRYWRHRVWDSIVYFWRIASTKGHLLGTLTKAARLCRGEISPFTRCPGFLANRGRKLGEVEGWRDGLGEA
jgi:hypothetical protein